MKTPPDKFNIISKIVHKFRLKVNKAWKCLEIYLHVQWSSYCLIFFYSYCEHRQGASTNDCDKELRSTRTRSLCSSNPSYT